MSETSLPIACSLTDAELQERSRDVLRRVGAAVVEVKELPDGYAYRLPSDTKWIGELAHLIQLERACCLFLRFQLIIEPDHGPIRLELTGPPGTKEFLAALFD
jgi:hypothetical protein